MDGSGIKEISAMVCFVLIKKCFRSIEELIISLSLQLNRRTKVMNPSSDRVRKQVAKKKLVLNIKGNRLRNDILYDRSREFHALTDYGCGITNIAKLVVYY